MSGTIRYKLDGRTSSATPAENNSDWFVSLYKYFQLQVASSQATIHASNFGNAGTGFDRHDEANPIGENAWFVVKMLASASTIRTNDYYLLIQWADANSFGNSPGNPGTLDGGGGDGLGICMAYRTDGGDPWNGTTNANGADTKGTPVWVDGGSTLVMWHSDNKTGGAQATNREDCHRIEDFSANTHRAHIWGDADALCMWTDLADDGTSVNIMYIGAYEPIAGATINNPLIHMSFDGGIPDPLSIFDTTSNYEGQMCGADDTDSYDYNLTRGIDGMFSDVIHQPSDQGGTVQHVEVPVYIVQRTGPDSGVAGNLIKQLIGQTFNVPANGNNAAVSRAFLAGGSSGLNNIKWSVAWAGGNPPGTGSGRDGVEV